MMIAGGMAAVSLAMPTKLWDPAGRECGRTFLYLHLFSYGKRLSQEPQSSIFTSRLSQSGISLQLDVPIHFWSLVGATFVFFSGKPSSFSQSTNTEATLGLIV